MDRLGRMDDCYIASVARGLGTGVDGDGGQVAVFWKVSRRIRD